MFLPGRGKRGALSQSLGGGYKQVVLKGGKGAARGIFTLTDEGGRSSGRSLSWKGAKFEKSRGDRFQRQRICKRVGSKKGEPSVEGARLSDEEMFKETSLAWTA